MTRENAIELLLAEINRAERLHPQWPADEVHAAAIVAEEAGELVQAALNHHYHRPKNSDPYVLDAEKMRTEAIHTGAMALRFLINMVEV